MGCETFWEKRVDWAGLLTPCFTLLAKELESESLFGNSSCDDPPSFTFLASSPLFAFRANSSNSFSSFAAKNNYPAVIGHLPLILSEQPSSATWINLSEEQAPNGNIPAWAIICLLCSFNFLMASCVNFL
jgi:hypothetical protein